MTAMTTARDGQVRTTTRGTLPKVITVRLPSGIRWSDLKDDIESAEALDRITSATISIPYATFPWYYGDVDPGTDESYTVICTTFPQWTIFARDQVQWSGAFVFTEVI